MTERVDIAPILRTLKELHDATRADGDPWIDLEAPETGLVLRGVEDRLVQVFRNLISNAESFSPPRGRIGILGGAERRIRGSRGR